MLFALVWLLLVRPVLAGFAERDVARQELLATYARGERVIGAMRATRGAMRAQRATLGQYAVLAPGAPFAIDTLRERVALAARAQKAKVGSVQETQAPAGSVAVRADITVALDRLGPLVAALENGAPLLTVEQMGVTADQAATGGHAAPVEVRLDLSARYDAARASAR